MNRRRESISRYRQSSPPPPLSTSKKRSFLELRQPSSTLYYNNGIILSSSSSNQSSTSSSSLANKYRFYRSSSDNNHLDDIYRYRINFDRMLIKINQIKLIVCAGCIFHLAFIITSDFTMIQKSSLLSAKESKQIHQNNSSTIFIEFETITIMSTFIFRLMGLGFGMIIGCLIEPERHLFMFNQLNTFHLNWLTFIIITVLDIISMMIFPLNLPFMEMFMIVMKSSISGIQLLLLLYALFDIKIDPLEEREAKCYIQLYLLMFIAGFLSALLLSLYYYSNLFGDNSSITVQSIIRSIIGCRIFLSLNWSTLSYLIWHYVASIHKHNIVRGVDFEEFLDNYAIDNDCTRYITLNCVALACQMRPGINVDDHFDEDNFSIRTVDGWQKTGFTIISRIQFAMAFYLCISYPIGCSIWPEQYYPKFLTGYHKFSLFLITMVIILFIRIYLLYRTDCIQNIRERLGCFTFIIVLFLYIAANIIQLFNDRYDEKHFPLVIIANIIIGLSIAQMMDEICHSIIDHLSITAHWIRYTIVTTIIFQSFMSVIHYYIMEKLAKIQWIFYLNISITLFLLITMIIISQCRCLNINSGFDLIEMQTMEPLSKILNDHHEDGNDDNVEVEDYIQNEMISPTGDQTFYRTNGKKRKQSMVSIFAYRMRYRFESIISTFNSK
uniref:Uncharacterized protein LOC113798588 n=1 Tax=Dermatophagoides pteronyssinus TaxID=6956 RepID=A0A6P6YHE8_DERPT|nr:uncharacterized protein LOC113798588 [Dermatophagoides pteronyssinus]